jgi:all-trans-retinol 13,14-reductase
MTKTVSKYDTLVIGGGISGIVCALLDARKGEKVAIVEQSDTLSPTLNGFFRRGIYLDSGFHYAGSIGNDGLLQYLLNELGIAGSLKDAIHILDSFDHVRIMKPSFDFLFPQGWESLEQTLSRTFPADTQGIKLFLTKVRTLSQQGRDTLVQNSPQNLEAFFAGDGCSVKEAIEKCTSNPVLGSLLSCHGVLYGSTIKETSMLFHSQIVGSYYESACFIEGGGRTIVDVLTKKLSESNVDIICGQKVCRICLDEQKTFASVEFQSGNKLSAGKCICTTHPKMLLEMMPPKAFSPAYRHRIEGLEETASAVVLFGKSSSSSFRGNLILAEEPDSFSDWPDMPVEERPLFVSCPGKKASSGISIICPATLADVPGKTDKKSDEYKNWKKMTAQRLIQRLSDCAGDLISQFELLDVATPLTFRDRLCSPKGGLYGIKHRLNDMPLLPRTSVKGLYLSGQAIVAPGLLGAMCSSFLTERFMS